MTPNQQGAFCSACSKCVIDFTNKRDNEIYELLTNSKGKVCGRFTDEQLGRPIAKTVIQRHIFNWKAIAAGLALLTTSKFAEGKDNSNKPPILNATKCAPKDSTIFKGKVAIQRYNPDTEFTDTEKDTREGKITIHAVVHDSKTNLPINGAYIVLEGTQYSAITSANGSFILVLPQGSKGKVQINNYGYHKSKEITVEELASPQQKKGQDGAIIIKLDAELVKNRPMIMGDVAF